jgi:putative Ca2+/H+ antiporter (TMEM165/GDT1 family)
MKMINLKHSLERYRDYAILNRNLIASIVSAMLVSAIFAQTIKGLSTHVNATTTIAVSYMVYYIVFGVLYYKSSKKKDTKQRYKTKTGIDRQRLRKDLFKIIISVGAAEIVYLITRWLLHYYLLETRQEPFTASIFAHIISASIFILIVNVGASLTKIFKPVSQSKTEDNSSYLN